MVLVIYLLFGFFICTCQNEISDNEYPEGALPCKMFYSSRLDCSNRDLSEIPTLPINITWLDLSSNPLENVSCGAFEGQGNLIYIDIGETDIQKIEGSPFIDLKAAQTLIVWYTYLRHLAPTSFRGLFNLLKLDLGSNFLRSLPKGIFVDLNQLQVLDIQNNNLMEIPSHAIAPLSSLQILDMKYNDLFTLYVGEGFKNLTSLREMYVRSKNLNSSKYSASNKKDNFDQSHVVLANDTFQNLANLPLERLTFIFDDVQNVTVEVESGILEPLGNLSHLTVFYEFENAMSSLRANLESLDILISPDDMKLTKASLDYINCKTSLKHLDLSFALIDGIYNAAFAEFSNLRILNLTGVIYSMQHFSNGAFQGLHNLEELYLANNQINTLPVDAFQAFYNGSLKILDLSYNALTGEFPYYDSFNSVSSITHLNLSHNPIESVGKWIHALKNLQELKMNTVTSLLRIDFLDWTVPLTTLRNFCFCWPDLRTTLEFDDSFSLSQKAPGLQKLSLVGSYVYELKMIIGLQDLRYLDAYKSFKKFKKFEMLWGKQLYFPNLKTLKLANNNIKTVNRMNLNTTTPVIKILVLKYNKIKTLEGTSLDTLPYLTYLDMTDNDLQTVSSVSNLPHIIHLLLPFNSISEISIAFVENLNNTVEFLDVSGNPFTCTCAIEPFRKWILSDNQVYLEPNAQYRCKTPEKLSEKSITEIHLDCESHLTFYLSISIASGLVACLVIIFTIKYRWNIKYRMFLLCTWRRRYQPLSSDEENSNVNGVRYDCFVSFAYECEKDLNWVLNDLRKNMEEGPEPFRLCIGHARDFIPGTPLLEAITEAIHNSRKTIIVLSPSYLDSEWCYFETQHAWLRLLNEGQDVIILVLLEPIPDAKMTMWLKQFLCKKGYLRWPQDNASQKLFFRCLREMIKKPTAVNRRYDS